MGGSTVRGIPRNVIIAHLAEITPQHCLRLVTQILSRETVVSELFEAKNDCADFSGAQLNLKSD